MNRMSILHDLVLDCLYRLHCKKLSNAKIRRELERRHLPLMNDEQIAMFRKEFQEKELKFPKEMQGIRNRLRIKST